MSHIQAETTPRRVPLPRGRFALGTTAIAAAASVAAVAVILFGPDAAGPSPAAAAVLRHAAQSAAGSTATAPPTAGQFVYTKSANSFENTIVPVGGIAINIVQHVTREAWIGPDGSGRLRAVASAGHFATPADREAWIAAGKPDVLGGSSSDEDFPAGGLSYLDLTGLPTDPTELRQRIEDRTVEGGPPGDAETFTIIGDLLRETYASPALRAALFTVASELPGVRLVGPTHDEMGRPGTAVAYDNHGLSHELIFDPDTSQILGERTVLLSARTVLDWTAYLASGVVDSTSARTSFQP